MCIDNIYDVIWVIGELLIDGWKGDIVFVGYCLKGEVVEGF